MASEHKYMDYDEAKAKRLAEKIREHKAAPQREYEIKPSGQKGNLVAETFPESEAEKEARLGEILGDALDKDHSQSEGNKRAAEVDDLLYARAKGVTTFDTVAVESEDYEGLKVTIPNKHYTALPTATEESDVLRVEGALASERSRGNEANPARIVALKGELAEAKALEAREMRNLEYLHSNPLDDAEVNQELEYAPLENQTFYVEDLDGKVHQFDNEDEAETFANAVEDDRQYNEDNDNGWD